MPVWQMHSHASLEEKMDEALIQKIMEEVIRTLNAQGICRHPSQEGLGRMLVIGDPDALPEQEKNKYILTDIDDYVQYKNILRYEKIYITRLSLTELSDIALGRDATPVSCAVVSALLQGIDVLLDEKALGHRKLAGKGSSRLYAVIEGNVRQLEGYGVKIIPLPKQEIVRETKPPKFNPPPVAVPKGSMQPNAARLITESLAVEMLKGNPACVCVAKNAIITPSAWDIFNKSKIEVVRE